MDNEPWSAITHLIGALLSIAGLTLLVVFAALYGTVWHVVGFSIFGTALILLYTASTTYHFIPITSRAKHILQRIDHSMIYVLIAGTYTPICLVTLHGAWGWSLFGVIWGLASAGVAIKSSGVQLRKWFSTAIYVLMGWLVVIAFVPLTSALDPMGWMWLVVGGICYTLGSVIFLFDEAKLPWRHFGLHEIWHLFVLGGSVCHFFFMLWHVL